MNEVYDTTIRAINIALYETDAELERYEHYAELVAALEEPVVDRLFSTPFSSGFQNWSADIVFGDERTARITDATVAVGVEASEYSCFPDKEHLEILALTRLGKQVDIVPERWCNGSRATK